MKLDQSKILMQKIYSNHPVDAKRSRTRLLLKEFLDKLQLNKNLTGWLTWQYRELSVNSKKS